MTETRCRIEVGGIDVEVVRKDIKNLHVGVYPPAGRVRVAAPVMLDDEAVRLAVVSRLGWIKRKRESFRTQRRQSAREMVTGESHYFQGQRYRLDVVERDEPPTVKIKNNSTIELAVRPNTNTAKRRAILDDWYRENLKAEVAELIERCAKDVGVAIPEWGIKKMKTRWGSCNADVPRIWLNLELAKKPRKCVEYILVHELIHLLERKHSDHFRERMDRALPSWRLYRDQLNEAPLSHSSWQY